MRVTREELGEFTGWTKEQYAKWLTTSLQEFYSTRKGHYAFRPLNKLFCKSTHITIDLFAIYNVLYKREQKKFRESLVLALRDTELVVGNENILEDLLAMIRMTKTTEAKDVLKDDYVRECLKAHKFRYGGLLDSVRWTQRVISLEERKDLDA